MDIEKLIHCLQCCARVDAHNIGCDDCGLEYCGEECQQLCGTAATALSTLKAENSRLRADLEYEREHADAYYEECGQWEAENEKLRAEVESLKKGHCAGCSIPAVKAEQIRDLTDAPKLRAELEQVKMECDAAKSTLAERIGVRGAEPITTAFGLPIDRLRELAKADREGRCVVLPCKVGDTLYDIYEAMGNGTGEIRELKVNDIRIHLDKRSKEWLIAGGYYFSLSDFGKTVFLTREDAQAALRREQE